MKEIKTIKYWLILLSTSIGSVIFTDQVLNLTAKDGIEYWIIMCSISVVLNFIFQNVKFNQTINSVYENGEEVYREENGKTTIDKRKND